jgi:tetratricopeptide (TPR) repeat protein
VRKEQILLLTSAVIGGLLILNASGKYTEVGASTLPQGTDVPVVSASQPDPTRDLDTKPLKGRPPLAPVRLEKRPPLPELPAPAALPPWFVRPIPTPGASAEHWRPFRGPIAAVTAPPDVPKDEPAPDAVPPVGKKFDPDKQAKLVAKSGEETLVSFELVGAFKGQPDWVILEKWPNVSVRVSFLNKTTGQPIGAQDIGPAELAGYQTVHLLRTLENEFHEERIRRGVKDADREALTKFAQWVWETLSDRVGSDESAGRYGLAAKKLAIGELRKAYALQADITLTRLLGEYYRGTYDIEGELQSYLAYLGDGRANDGAAQVLVGDAYERVGALAAARGLYDKAVKTGDPEAKLRVGLSAERELRLDDAMRTLKTVANTPGVGSKALLAMARIALAQGNVSEAAGYIDQAKKEIASPALNLVLGSVQYAQGKFVEAQMSWAAAIEADGGTTWRSNRGMALLAAGDFDGAQKDFIGCLDDDPLNLLDPLFGLGAVFQRKGQDQRSNDYFETALARSPDNPWILLRLGTVRLSGGQAEKALAFGMHLLDVEPGCVDGLWLVGRAAASLDKPDYEKAILYLRRATEKEPDNRDLLLEHARTLVLSGRLDEALKVLETATEVRSGFARNDARAMSVLAWARFLAKRPIADVFEAIQRGLRANPDDDTKKWLDSVRKIMDDWDRTRIWEDGFDRPNAQVVGNGWKESDAAHGISIGISNGQALVRSTMVKQPAATRDAATRLTREDDLGRFKSLEVSFKASVGVEAIAHMFLGALPDRGAGGESPGPRGPRAAQGGVEIGFGCDRNGNMVLWAPVGKTSPKEYILKDAAGAPRQWPMDDFHTVRFVRKDDLKGIYEIWLDDERIGSPDGKSSTFEIGALSLQPGKMFGLGFLVDADSGASVDVFVEYVRVTKTNK